MKVEKREVARPVEYEYHLTLTANEARLLIEVISYPFTIAWAVAEKQAAAKQTDMINRNEVLALLSDLRDALGAVDA